MPSPINQLSEEQMAGIVAKREAHLLEKYVYGKTSPREELEIAHLIADLERFRGHSTPPPVLQKESRSAHVENVDAGPAFSLDPPEASQPRRRTGYQHELEVYADRYGADVRTVKRWASDGRKATPADSCPLDDPQKMPEWWSRRKVQRVPPAILAAASAASVAVNSDKCGDLVLSFNQQEGTARPSDPTRLTLPVPVVGSIDLTTIETPEGLALQQARVFVAATYRKLDAAYREGKDEDIRLWQPRWEKATETLRKAESEDRLAQKHRGDLLPRGSVMEDLATLLQTLKVLRASMWKRILAHVPQLPPELADPLRAAVEVERDREDDVLRNLQTLRTPSEAAERFELQPA